MLFRVLFFVLMALGLTGFGTAAWIMSRPPATAVAAVTPPAKKMVVVTARAIHAGSLLKPEDLTTKEVAIALDNGEFTVESIDAQRALIGSMMRRAMGPGEIMRSADLTKPGEHGFLAAVMEPGKRAVTIGVDATSGSAGLIWPGDRVDVILTMASADPTVRPGRRVAAETVLPNARVIAIDQQLVQGAAPSGGDAQSRTVTLEVLPGDAERVSVAMRLGRLSLSLRSADAVNATAEGRDRTTWALDVSSAVGSDAAPAIENVVRVFRGAGEAREFKF